MRLRELPGRPLGPAQARVAVEAAGVNPVDAGNRGDPSWAGALAGVALELPVYHVTEEAVKAEIAPSDYDEHLALMAMAMDVDAIGEAVRGVREGKG